MVNERVGDFVGSWVLGRRGCFVGVCWERDGERGRERVRFDYIVLEGLYDVVGGVGRGI